MEKGVVEGTVDCMVDTLCEDPGRPVVTMFFQFGKCQFVEPTVLEPMSFWQNCFEARHLGLYLLIDGGGSPRIFQGALPDRFQMRHEPAPN